MKFLIIVILVFIFSFILSSCGVSPVYEPIITPSPEITNTQIPTSTCTPTPTPTTDTKIELMKQVNLFLNSEEPFRENEDLYWIKFRPFHTTKIPKLGLVFADADNGIVNFQGVFLGYTETTDGIVLLLGVQDKVGERFITPLKIYDEKFDLYKDVGNGFMYFVENSSYTNSIGEPIMLNTKKEVMEFLSTKIGQIFGIQLSLLPQPPLSEDVKKWMFEEGWTDPELSTKLINDFQKNYEEVNRDLSASLWVPSPQDWDIRNGGLTISQNLQKMGEASGKAITITSIEDIDRVLQIVWLPCPDFIFGRSK